MVDTSFYFDPEKTERQAVLYSREGIPSAFLKDGFLSKSTGPGLEPAHESLILGYTDKGMFEWRRRLCCQPPRLFAVCQHVT